MLSKKSTKNLVISNSDYIVKVLVTTATAKSRLTTSRMKNLILVGLGPHARRIYYPLVEKHHERHDIHLKLVIDLESQRMTIEDYLRAKKIQPEKVLYLKDSNANLSGDRLDETAKKELNRLRATTDVHGIIISTEPKAHKIYAEWALKNGVNVLMDKPITAPLFPGTDLAAAQQIYGDYMDMKHLLNVSSAKCYVTCQRRNHAGYTYIKKYLQDFTAEFNVPVSYIDVYHADGAWSLPHEFHKENHPYKYGYGKLMHSGYHFIDLFAWLFDTNQTNTRFAADSAKLYTASFTPNDLFHQIDEQALGKMFGHQPAIRDFYRSYNRTTYDHFGELDAYILIQLLRQGNVVTSGTINLQQNSFSRRGWFDLPADTYKGNGRTRHERVNIQISHFLNIQVHSYQSREKNERIKEGEAGSEDHFDIYIFRNSQIVGGQAFTKITIGQTLKDAYRNDPYYLGHNEKARETTLLNFLAGADDESSFERHDLTNRLLANIYTSIAQEATTGNSQVKVKL
jgi:hypothetical protein